MFQFCIICDIQSLFFIPSLTVENSLTLAIHAVYTSVYIPSSQLGYCKLSLLLFTGRRHASYEGFLCFKCGKYGHWAKDCGSAFRPGGHSYQSYIHNSLPRPYSLTTSQQKLTRANQLPCIEEVQVQEIAETFEEVSGLPGMRNG